MTSQDPLEFKFQFLDETGNAKSFLRKKGRFEDRVLTLDDVEIPAAAMADCQVLEKRMLFAVPDGEGGLGSLMVDLPSASTAADLKTRVDAARSRQWADAYCEDLEKKGRGGSYREAECPRCVATLVLSDMPETPQVFCNYCGTLSTQGQAAPPAEATHRLCEECGMYSQPAKFTVFYFYFLLVVYGWRSRTKWCCKGCMRGDAWKMLLGNLPFVLGVPVAVTQLVRAYSGGSVVEGQFAGLNAANVAARKQDWDKAVAGYRAVLERVGVSAGVKYNLGAALRSAGREEQAARSMELALADCANYTPAYANLRELLPALGEHEKLAELAAQWDEAEERGAAEEDIPPDAV